MVIVFEDSCFYWYIGIDFIGIVRVILINLCLDGICEGGSMVI